MHRSSIHLFSLHNAFLCVWVLRELESSLLCSRLHQYDTDCFTGCGAGWYGRHVSIFWRNELLPSSRLTTGWSNSLWNIHIYLSKHMMSDSTVQKMYIPCCNFCWWPWYDEISRWVLNSSEMWPLKKRPLRCLVTSGSRQPVTRRHIRDGWWPQLHRCESLNSRWDYGCKIGHSLLPLSSI
jgi:hypothetical protein